VPCTPFSVAGQQLGAADSRDLYSWAIDLALRMRPRALLLENVRGLAEPRFAAYRESVAHRLGGAGYWCEWRMLNASDFWVPQLRPRYVLVAMGLEEAARFRWPSPIAQRAPTVGDALWALMASRGWKGSTDWAERANTIAPTIVGGSRKHGGPDLGPVRARAAWAKLGVDGRSIADEAPGPDEPADHVPRLTTEMVERIQGFNPAWGWTFTGRKTTRYRQIGNAFPPPVAKAVGMAIKEALL
jgi:DNA (cytosine-5)-methyltransferase 1